MTSGDWNMSELSSSKPWKAKPLVKATAGVHALAAAGLLVPGAWPWCFGAVAVNHALITAAGLWPRSQWLGSNLTHLERTGSVVAITIDDGPDPEITPAVLDILDSRKAVATFFCIGAHVQRYPELAREIVRRGHSIGNHSQNHRHHFSVMTPGQISREVSQAQTSIEDATGIRPVYFRAPAGLRNIFLDPVLHKLNLKLASWTRRSFDTRVGDTRRVTERLTRGLQAGDILLLHDHHAAITPEGQAVILEVLPALLDAIESAGYRTVCLGQGVT
jgi:peptidoglycan/xylan/chitin deacetylase (PgdA/CDA1 family)